MATPLRPRAPSTYMTPNHTGVIVGRTSAGMKHEDPGENGRKPESRGST
jgi:hypothetical protein